MRDFEVTVKLSIPACASKQAVLVVVGEAIDYVEDNIGLSEFHLEIEHLLETGRIKDK